MEEAFVPVIKLSFDSIEVSFYIYILTYKGIVNAKIAIPPPPECCFKYNFFFLLILD